MALAGVPQWMAPRLILYSGSGTSEVDVMAANGLLNLAAGIGLETGLTKTITAGPTTAGPVIIEAQNTVWALPFNVACSAPLFVWDALIRTTDTATPGGQWVAA